MEDDNKYLNELGFKILNKGWIRYVLGPFQIERSASDNFWILRFSESDGKLYHKVETISTGYLRSLLKPTIDTFTLKMIKHIEKDMSLVERIKSFKF